jgi:uncharacterized protein (AIM24 family)
MSGSKKTSIRKSNNRKSNNRKSNKRRLRRSHRKDSSKRFHNKIYGGAVKENVPLYKYVNSGMSKGLEVNLKNQTMLTGHGALQYCDPALNLDIYTGGIGSMFMRFISSAPVFMLRIQGTGRAVFSSELPADIVEMHIKEGEEYIFPDKTFLCCTGNVEIGAATKLKGLIFGLNFIINAAKVKPGTGEGVVWVSGYGGAQKIDLAAGESLKVQPGLLLMMPSTTDISVASVGSIGATFLGGEGLYMSKITGPTTIWLSNKSIQDFNYHIREIARDVVKENNKKGGAAGGGGGFQITLGK